LAKKTRLRWTKRMIVERFNRQILWTAGYEPREISRICTPPLSSVKAIVPHETIEAALRKKLDQILISTRSSLE